jgi:two-component system, sensor histidine kinase PdtaS
MKRSDSPKLYRDPRQRRPGGLKGPGGPVTISLIYFLFGFLWILISDHLLFMLVPDIEAYSALQTRKGWIYVGITTLMIYSLLKLYSNRKNRITEELAEKNREKNTLIRELHHRVKNNLQLIISIINLSGSSPEIERITGRIYTVSTIQEAIFSGDIYAQVTLDRYLRDIAGYIRGKLGRPPASKLELDIPLELSLPSESAVPLGIIFYELLRNAMIHGDREGKTISASMEKEGELLYLQIRDQGEGFSPSPEKEKTGLLLVRIMAQEIGGTIQFRSGEEGTKVEFKFKSRLANTN